MSNDAQDLIDTLKTVTTAIKEKVQDSIQENAEQQYDTTSNNFTTYEEMLKQEEIKKKRKKSAPKVIKFIATVWILSVLLPIIIPIVFESVGFFLEIHEALKESENDGYMIEDMFDSAIEETYPEYVEDIVDNKNDTEKVEDSKSEKKFNFSFKEWLPKSDTNWTLIIVGALAVGVVLVLILRKVTTKKEVIYDGFNYTVKDNITNADSSTITESISDNLDDSSIDIEDTE